MLTMAKRRLRLCPGGSRTGSHHFWFWCPGCEEAHQFEVPRWGFNGDFERPSFSPSLLLRRPGLHCHLFLREGQLQFLGDWTQLIQRESTSNRIDVLCRPFRGYRKIHGRIYAVWLPDADTYCAKRISDDPADLVRRLLEIITLT